MTLPKLLLVDDEANILQALRRALRKMNAEIVTTTSPREALRLVEQESFAVVVSDQRMPDMVGTALLEKVRALSPDSIRMILTGYADIQATVDAINKGAVYRYLNKPWDEAELRNTVRQGMDQFLLVQENRRLKELTNRQNQELKQLNDGLKEKVMDRTFEVLRLNQLLEQSFLSAVEVMAHMAELHSRAMGSHAKRVAVLAREIAKGLGCQGKTLSQIEIAAMLHDIGKINIDPALLRLSEAERTDAQRAVLREHPAQGERLMQRIPDLGEAARYVRHHHERFDGSGYPDGLSGSLIPLGARIIATADAYDHALNDLHLSAQQALQRVQREARGAFDPSVLDALAKVVRAVAGTERTGEIRVRLQDLRAGMVLSRNLCSNRGQLLLKKNTMVHQGLIDRLLRQHADDPIQEHVAVYRKWPMN